MPTKAKLFLVVVWALGLMSIIQALASLHSVPSGARMALFVVLTAAASIVKIRLPGLEGTYSLNAVFLLAGVVYLTLPETVFAAAAGVLVQSYAAAERRPAFVQILFNLANEIFCVAIASASLSFMVLAGTLPFRPALLAAAAAIYFVLNTGLVSGILTLLGGPAFSEINKKWYAWSFPYYLLGAAAIGVIPLDGRSIDHEAWVVLVPLAYLAHFFCGLAEGRAGQAGTDETKPAAVPGSAKALTVAVAATAASFVAFAASRAESIHWGWFLCYLTLGIMTATWKARLPKTTGTISVHFVVVLVAVAQSSMIEALVIAAAGPLVQTYWRARSKPLPVQVLFNVATMIVATGVSFSMCRIIGGAALQPWLLGTLACATALHFLTNTLLVSVVMSLVEKEGVFSLWRRLYFWVFPIYLVGAAVSAVMVATTRAAGWLPSLLVLPLMAMAQFSYRLHVAEYGNLPKLGDRGRQPA